MKPIALYMHHFGPFTEEKIDFTKLDKELFLIAGPTGSGKTTIFDGLCYALYGEGSNTFRQSREMKSQFGDPLEMMWVDFTFELREKTYRIKRIPEQDRKKERGQGTARQKHEAVLYELAHGEEKLISASVAEVGEKVQEILGINANQFRQIVMLPQGEFSRLLKAREEERVELLKSIFRMDLYNNLKDKVASGLREIRGRHNDLSVEMDTERQHIKSSADSALAETLAQNDKTMDYVLDLTRKEIQTDTAKIAALAAQEKQTVQTLEQLRITLAAGEQINSRFEQLEAQRKRLKELEQERDVIREKEEALALSKKALSVKPYEEAWTRAYRQKERAEAELKGVRERLETCRKALEKSETEYEAVSAPAYSAVIEQLQEKLDIEKRLAESLRAYEEKHTGLQKRSGELAQLEEKGKRQQEDSESLKKLEHESYTLDKEIFELEKAFQRSGHELENLAGRQKRVEEALEIYRVIESREQRIADLRKEWKENQNHIKAQEAACQALAERQRQQTAAGLAAGLEEGQPCPVCGSVHHPQRAEAQEAVDEAVLSETTERLNTLKIKSGSLKNDGTLQRREIETRQAELLTRLAEIMAVTDNALPAKAEVSSLQKNLEERFEVLHAKCQNAEKQLKAKQKEKSGLEAVEKKLKVQLESYGALEEQLKEAREEAGLLRGQLSQMEQQIKVLAETLKFPPEMDNPGEFLNKIESFERNTRALIAEKKGYKDNIQANHQKLLQEEAVEAANYKSGSRTLEKAAEDEDKLNNDYSNALRSAGLTPEAYAGCHNMSGEAIQTMEAALEQYRFNLKSTAERVQELEDGLRDKTPVELTRYREDQQALEAQIEGCRREATILNEKNAQNRRQIGKIEGLAQELKEVERLQGIYTHLDQTIKGTLAGKPKISFERYILSAYLQDILESANVFLEKMSSGRYRLEVMGDFRQSGNRGLEIEVVDAYTGLRRSANTLSGGETFMAALSMALGLSDIVQSYAGGISLDTIFIDEGFATLDPEALDNAISCLLAIKNDGRTVGIISHVEELKDRIDTKIIVEKTETGSHIDISC
ncbi:AAA family ATPase [Eubacterium sp. 1001713B170207_170306_E7]|uniref:AAA family ATPase n=1 Tax=Eubacterium sp. 1001713B170207_170306_E7 TaxID=2787097 RepID=UPI00189A533E|nr:AAA family ATPase [Eubacterium sp. 1001713B170207_170306_E7]